jgi:hypothetical protein
MAAPSFVALTTLEGNLQNMTINKPSGVVEGDILVAIISRDAIAESTLAPDNFWVRQYSATSTLAQISENEAFAIYTKIAGASEPASYTFSTTNVCNVAVILAAYRPSSSSVSINVLGSLTLNAVSNITPITVTANSITTSVNDTRILWFSAANPNSSGVVSGFTAPSGMTERAEAGGGGWSRCVLADQTFATAGVTGNKSGTLTLANSTNVSGYIAGMFAIASSGVAVLNVDDDDENIRSDQTNVSVTGLGFGASQGSGSVTLRQGTASVTQSIDSWSDTAIQFDTVILASGADIKHGNAALRVTNNSSDSGQLDITVAPPTGQFFVDLASIATSAPERITAFPDLVSGDQLWIRGVGDTAAPTGLTVNPDASFFFEEGTTPADFEVRVWDSSDATWGDWSSFGFLSSLVGTTSVGTVITDPVTIVVLTGNAATAYLANVDPGLETTITGIQITGSAGVVTIDTGSVFVVTGVVGTSQLAKLNIWNTIISSQAPNWVVIVT